MEQQYVRNVLRRSRIEIRNCGATSRVDADVKIVRKTTSTRESEWMGDERRNLGKYIYLIRFVHPQRMEYVMPISTKVLRWSSSKPLSNREERVVKV